MRDLKVKCDRFPRDEVVLRVRNPGGGDEVQICAGLGAAIKGPGRIRRIAAWLHEAADHLEGVRPKPDDPEVI